MDNKAVSSNTLVIILLTTIVIALLLWGWVLVQSERWYGMSPYMMRMMNWHDYGNW